MIYEETKTIYKMNIHVLAVYLNYGNHLGYDSLLSILQEARMNWLKENNMQELSVSKSVGYLITDVSVSYQAEAFHGDILEVALYISNLTKKTFMFNYKVKNITSEKMVAVAETKHVFYDFELKKVASVPDNFIQAAEF